MKWINYSDEKPIHGDIVIVKDHHGDIALVEWDTEWMGREPQWWPVGFSGYEWDWDIEESEVIEWCLIERKQ